LINVQQPSRNSDYTYVEDITSFIYNFVLSSSSAEIKGKAKMQMASS
jgi:hypothetical protein